MNDSVRFGFNRTAVSLGLDPYMLITKLAALNIVDNSLEELQLYSRAGALIFENAGYGGTIEHRILQKCASMDTLLSDEAYNMYIKPVKDTLCKKASIDKAAGLGSVLAAGGKGAAWLAGMLADSPKLLLALAAGTGALGGGALYAMNRAVNLRDAETEAKFELARLYREQANHIAKQMANKGKAPVNPGFIF